MKKVLMRDLYRYDDGWYHRVVYTGPANMVITSTPGLAEVFLVGGGGGGGGGVSNLYGSGGGGGGYTKTIKKVPKRNSIAFIARSSLNEGEQTKYSVFVAEGGRRGGNGSPTYLWASGVGGAGGSGGGGGGGSGDGRGSGGADGGNGSAGTGEGGSAAGTGQGSTTREFGLPSAILYSGGGGGGGRNSAAGSGGAGGGGAGGDRGYAGHDASFYGGGGGGAGQSTAPNELAGGAGFGGICITRTRRIPLGVIPMTHYLMTQTNVFVIQRRFRR